MKRIEEKNVHIKELFKIQGFSNGKIFMNEKNVSIFEIGEICLLEQDKNIEQVIKNAYTACIREITINYQILLKTDKIDMEEYIDEISKKQQNLLSDELKTASRRYIEYMKNIWKAKQIFITKYYFIASDLSKDQEKDIEIAFKNMEELGINIKKIEDDKKIYDLMHFCINQN